MSRTERGQHSHQRVGPSLLLVDTQQALGSQVGPGRRATPPPPPAQRLAPNAPAGAHLPRRAAGTTGVTSPLWALSRAKSGCAGAGQRQGGRGASE
ncbi:hypothetical protein VULLAG_LOCUS962 [Vulpes lagopus]